MPLVDNNDTTPPLGMEPLLDVNELAAYLGVPVSDSVRLAHQRQEPARSGSAGG
jgi:hypothetical protein